MMDQPASPAGNGALVDQVVARLESAILTGALQPGQRLAEQALAAELGVGRGPLREAVRTLEGRRLVQRTPYSGVRVVSLTLEDFEQLLITREALEGMASRQAAECMTLAETRRVRAFLSDFDGRIRQEGVAGAYAHGTPENDFHVQVVRGSRNRWLEGFLCRDLYSLIRVFRFRSAVVGQRAAVATAEHLAILESIERRDPDSAERLMRAHIGNARRNLISRLQEETIVSQPVL